MAKKVRYDDYPDREDIRRRSYTDYSARFPGDNGKTGVSREEREKRQKSMLTILATAGCLGIIFVGFFVTLVLLSVSRQEPGEEIPGATGNAPTSATVTTTSPPAEAGLGKIRAMTAPEAALGGGNTLNRFINAAKDANCNTAIFVIKTDAGNVLYPSKLEQAGKGDILNKNYKAAADSIAAAKKAGLNVILRISCFRDSTAPSAISDAAVRYSRDTRMLWLDDYPDRGGKPWLNPFSKDARDYLLAIIKEAAAMKPDAIYLTGVQFPSGAQALAAFPGEDRANAPTRNAQLLAFIKDAKSAAGKLPLLCEMDAQAALQAAGAAIYGGDLWPADADVLIIPVSGEAEAKLVQSAAPRGTRWVPQMKDAPRAGAFEEFFVY